MKPKPPLVLILCALGVIAACLLAISNGIAGMARPMNWGPDGLVVGSIVLLLPLTLAVQQYRAAFRANASTGRATAIALFLIGGFALLAATLTGFSMLKNAAPSFDILVVPAPLGVIGLLSCFAAWMNLRWSKWLKQLGSLPSGDSRFSLRELLALLTAVACVMGLMAFFLRPALPPFAENVRREKCPYSLPAKARDVSYCMGHRGTRAYEFTIDEESFIEWVESGIGAFESSAVNTQLQPITKPYKIARYESLTPHLTPRFQRSDFITITDGLFYDWSFEDRGVHSAFDRDTNRAYYYAHFH